MTEHQTESMEQMDQIDQADQMNREPAEIPAIEIDQLTKTYGANKALDAISFNVKKGEIMGFLGPNGAGKSTAMNILTGYLAASHGSVRIDGVDTVASPNITKRKIGYLPEIPPLYTDMTVGEYLDFVYQLKGVSANKKAHLRKVMEKVHIYDVRGRLIQNLSKGYRQRVGLAQALIGDPEVLVLDEPTVGLDPKQIMEIRDVISDLGRERTVILSTHILQEVTAVCDSYTIINHGKIVAGGSMSELSAAGDSGRFKLRIKGSVARAMELLEGVPGLVSVQGSGSLEPGTVDLVLEEESGADIREDVFRRMAAGDCPILSFMSSALTLEEIFLQAISADEAHNGEPTEEDPFAGENGEGAAEAEAAEAEPEAAEQAEQDVPETQEDKEDEEA